MAQKDRFLQASWVAADGRVVQRPRCIEIYDGSGGGFDGCWVPMSEAVAGDYDPLPRQARDVDGSGSGSGSSEEDEDDGSDEGGRPLFCDGLRLFRLAKTVFLSHLYV